MNPDPLFVPSVSSFQHLLCDVYCAVIVLCLHRDDRKDDVRWYSGDQFSIKWVERDESNKGGNKRDREYLR